ncbi:MAG: DUF2550 domain-containing protein [Nocardioides sp.]
MPLWQLLLDAAGAVLVLVLLYGLALVVRRRLLSRHGGTFELSCRVRSERAGRGWLLGLGRYSGDSLEWFRIFSLSPRPKKTWPRGTISYTGRRDPEGSERISLYPDHTVVQCESPGGLLELAMASSSLMGFQSWLEAAPPGTATTV